ncbi:MAG: hypothetical protein V5A44_00415 [Haloarculaceae archaeon]
MEDLILQAGGGLLESVGQVAAVVASLLIVLMVVALVGYAYKSLRGDGIEWPEDREPEEANDGVNQGGDDDEWDYY